MSGRLGPIFRTRSVSDVDMDAATGKGWQQGGVVIQLSNAGNVNLVLAPTFLSLCGEAVSKI